MKKVLVTSNSTQIQWSYSDLSWLAATSFSFSFSSPVYTEQTHIIRGNALPIGKQSKIQFEIRSNLVQIENNIWPTNELSLDEYLRKSGPGAAYKEQGI